MASNARHPTVKPAPYTRDQNMKAFDTLPKAVREALRYSENDWSAAAIKSGMRRLKAKSAAIVERIKHQDEAHR